ncbi:TetR/AcrR family transcriptional regulator [Halovulum sp. GXIMD14794]
MKSRPADPGDDTTLTGTTGCCTGPARRGRPVAIDPETRRRLVFDAMDAVFADAGEKALTMDLIARQAGMSKRTIYTLFGDRESLFAAYLEQDLDSFLPPLPPEALDLPLEDRLGALLRPQIDFGACRLPLAILRVLVQMTPERPGLARRALEAGHMRIVDRIRTELARANARGEARIRDLDAAADLLCDMSYPAPLMAILGPEATPDIEVRRARVDLAVKVFMGGLDAL